MHDALASILGDLVAEFGTDCVIDLPTLCEVVAYHADPSMGTIHALRDRWHGGLILRLTPAGYVVRSVRSYTYMVPGARQGCDNDNHVGAVPTSWVL